MFMSNPLREGILTYSTFCSYMYVCMYITLFSTLLFFTWRLFHGIKYEEIFLLSFPSLFIVHGTALCGCVRELFDGETELYSLTDIHLLQSG